MNNMILPEIHSGRIINSGAFQSVAAKQRRRASTTKQSGTHPIEPTLAFAAAQITCGTIGTQTVSQFAAQIEHNPGRDHDQ